MDLFEKIGATWQKVSLVQKALLIAIFLTFVIAGGLLSRWAGKPDMGILYQSLPPEEAAKVVDKISEKDIPYELRNGGMTIFVPKDKIHQLRLDMARDGIATSSQGGYKIFDNEKIGVSPFVQNINLKRALQDELAKSIQMIDGVDYARVHLASGKQSMFSSKASKKTAAVVLKLRAGYRLGGFNIAAITSLVAGSVEGLQAGNVTVIDSQGQLLSRKQNGGVASGADGVQDYRERVERNLASKVENMLTAVLGPDRATVKVSAIIDMTSTNTITETPIKGVPKREEETIGSEIGASTTTSADGKPLPGSTKKDGGTVTEYDNGRSIKKEVVLPGEIKSLKVAAIVDLTPADVDDSDGAAAPAKIIELEDVRKLIANALGVDSTDMEALTVVEARFHRPTDMLIDEEPSSWPKYIAIARQGSMGIMAVCALLVLKIFSGAKKKADEPSAKQLTAAGGPAGLLPSGDGDPMTLRREITTALNSNPDQVKQLFSTWLESKEG